MNPWVVAGCFMFLWIIWDLLADLDAAHREIARLREEKK